MIFVKNSDRFRDGLCVYCVVDCILYVNKLFEQYKSCLLFPQCELYWLFAYKLYLLFAKCELYWLFAYKWYLLLAQYELYCFCLLVVFAIGAV